MIKLLQRQVFYLRDRAVNAFWLVRERRFREAYENLILELRTRKVQIDSALVAAQTPVERAEGKNPCRPETPSAIPGLIVVARGNTPPSLADSRVDTTLRSLLAAPDSLQRASRLERPVD